MNGSKGAFYGLAAAAGFVLSIVLLFTMVGGSGSSAETGDPVLNPNKVPAAYLQWVQSAGGECTAVSAPQIAAQIQQESSWNPNALSSAGAEGIAQFMPDTWPQWGQADAPGPVSPYNAGDAIMAMGRYDCAIAKTVAGVPGDPLGNMLAGYNAGTGAVLQYNGIPPFAQTQQYVSSIEALIPQYELTLAGGPAPGGSSFAQAEIAAAEKYINTPYVWGGGDINGPTNGGFDCSGLVLYAVYQASGGKITLPHSSEVQATMGTEVAPSDLQPGDVIAIQTEGPGDYSHVVIYIGNGQIVEAPRSGEEVRSAQLSEYADMVQTIRRFG